ncbi:unnamed protein product, partial [Vitis vinifera]|uniref:Uncharacterized protein n=1 Tax=Vitis vinifera TaxID=29760 RepID=D7SPI1_VITVI
MVTGHCRWKTNRE